MGRPPLPIGTCGKIRIYPAGSGFRAVTKFRDFDGVTRPVERAGKSGAAAERNLKAALRDRAGTTSGSITGDTRFREVAEQWFATVVTAVEDGRRSPNTSQQYRGYLDRSVLPGLGALRVREVTVPRVDAFLSATRANRGPAAAKACRAIVSGVLGLAVRYGALPTNPTRDADRIEVRSTRTPRALTFAERTAFLVQLEADRAAVRKDVPDLVRFMLATGVRIGESLAVFWSDVDLAGRQVAVDHTVIRVKGRGLVRKSTKSAAGERTLPLPFWAVDMLRRRHQDQGEPDDGPVFPDSRGGMRDPSNTRRDLRRARGDAGFAWVTSHVFRKTAATVLDEAGLPARLVADQLGHAQPSMTQNVYLGRKAVDRRTADALEGLFGPASSGETCG